VDIITELIHFCEFPEIFLCHTRPSGKTNLPTCLALFNNELNICTMSTFRTIVIF
jgi:hypothetical protein